MAIIYKNSCAKYRAANGDRLDTIVVKHYGTLDLFETVLVINAKLNPILKDGDIVYLPAVVQEDKEAEIW
jgi:phage tail protein X